MTGMRPAQLLAALAGGRRDLLNQSPSDLIRYAAMGGVILTTSCIAAVSGAIAVHMALQVSHPWAIGVGLFWGLVIFNLDRLLVTQMIRQTNRKHPILLAVPRLLLAAVLGVVISTPLVLKIFGPEIQVELRTIHQEKIAAYTRQVDSTIYQDIPTLQNKLDAARQTLGTVPGTSPGTSVDDNQEVRNAQARFDQAERAFETAEQNVVCEKEGTCGSGKAGAGIAYREKVAIRDQAQRRRDAAQTRLDEVRARVSGQLAETGKAQQSTAQSTADGARRDLDTQRAKRAADLKQYTADVNKDTGLLARLEALNRLSEKRSALLAAHLMLFLLFLLIELLPVLVKLLQVLGPETTYEKLTTKADETARRLHEADTDARIHTQQSQLTVAQQLEKDRSRRALSAGRKHNRRMVQTQSTIITASLQAWSDHALNAAQAALVRWQQQRGVQAVNPVPTSPPAPGPAVNPVPAVHPIPVAGPASDPAVRRYPLAAVQLPPDAQVAGSGTDGSPAGKGHSWTTPCPDTTSTEPTPFSPAYGTSCDDGTGYPEPLVTLGGHPTDRVADHRPRAGRYQGRGEGLFESRTGEDIVDVAALERGRHRAGPAKAHDQEADDPDSPSAFIFDDPNTRVTQAPRWTAQTRAEATQAETAEAQTRLVPRRLDPGSEPTGPDDERPGRHR